MSGRTAIEMGRRERKRINRQEISWLDACDVEDICAARVWKICVHTVNRTDRKARLVRNAVNKSNGSEVWKRKGSHGNLLREMVGQERTKLVTKRTTTRLMKC